MRQLWYLCPLSYILVGMYPTVSLSFCIVSVSGHVHLVALPNVRKVSLDEMLVSIKDFKQECEV